MTALPILGPYMDAGRHPSALRKGTFSRVVGTDGRFVGCLRPFPGCRRVTFKGTPALYTLADAVGSGVTSLGSITFCKYVQLQRATTADTLSGFVVRGTSTINTVAAVRLHFIYYDSSAAAWALQVINSGTAVSNTAAVDVTTYGKFLYVAVSGNANYPRTVWTTLVESVLTWSDKAMGPQYTTLAAPTLGNSGTETGGNLAAGGTYGIAYRFYDSGRAIYSAMSSVLWAEVETGDNYLQIDFAYPGGTPNDFDTIQVFRTIRSDVAGTPFEGGILYKEREISMPAAWASGKIGRAHV